MVDPSPPTADEYMPGRGRVGRRAGVALRWVGAGVALLLAVGGLVYLTRSSGADRPSSPAAGVASVPAVAAASAHASAVAAAPLQPAGDPVALLTAVEASLTRVVPGATLESPEMVTGQMVGQGLHVRTYGLLRNGDRVGALNVIVSTSAAPMTCDGFASCDIRAGRCGSTVRRVEFARPVPKGQPRDLEIRVAVRWKSDVLVDTILNNAVALYHAGSPIPAHTGQTPPLNLAQLADFAQEPALNVLAAPPATACP
jgi:hypothetical protein